MAGEKKLLLKLLGIINNNYNEKDLEDLILALVNQILLIIRRKSGLHFRLASYEPRDIALLTVSSLFVRNKQGRFPVLERLFNWKIVEKFLSASETDFQRYLKNILLRRLKQTFYYLSSEIRPERARIKREILYTLKKSSEYNLQKAGEKLLVTFIPQNSHGQPPEKLTEDQADRLLAICLDSGLGGLQVPKFFKKLAESLERNHLQIELTIQQLLEIYVETQKHYLLAEVSSSFHYKKQLPASDFHENLCGWINELRERNNRLLHKYVQKNKIKPEEKEIYLKALDDLIMDWQDGGQEKSLFSYLQNYQPEISQEEYRQEKRKILEYLVKNSRNFLKNKLDAWQTL
ncbi:MAG: hypothetical protein H5U06_10360 [Candidatus Aminicenantes bacterium]|nr:hypothetical protein [Candidatus Aminicenantes bacterium]